MCVKRWLALVLVFILIAPPALSAGSPETPSTDTPAGPRAYEPWWDYEWGCRRPVTIDNRGNQAGLFGYPVLMNLTYDTDMSANFSMLNF